MRSELKGWSVQWPARKMCLDQLTKWTEIQSLNGWIGDFTVGFSSTLHALQGSFWWLVGSSVESQPSSFLPSSLWQVSPVLYGLANSLVDSLGDSLVLFHMVSPHATNDAAFNILSTCCLDGPRWSLMLRFMFSVLLSVLLNVICSVIWSIRIRMMHCVRA